MKPQGIILKRIREAKKLSLEEAGTQIGKSIGWLSEVENDKGKAKLSQEEFDRILQIYGGEKYKSSFGGWLRQSESDETVDVSLDGAIFRYVRTQAGFSTRQAVKLLEISLGQLSKIENGEKVPDMEMREKMLKLYGYQAQSFKNFRPNSSRGHAIPLEYKLQIMMRRLDQERLSKVFGYVSILAVEMDKSEKESVQETHLKVV